MHSTLITALALLIAASLALGNPEPAPVPSSADDLHINVLVRGNADSQSEHYGILSQPTNGSQITAGQSMPFNYETKNAMTASIRIALVSASTGEVYVIGKNLKVVKSGAEKRVCQTSIDIPAGVEPGSYYFGVRERQPRSRKRCPTCPAPAGKKWDTEFCATGSGESIGPIYVTVTGASCTVNCGQQQSGTKQCTGDCEAHSKPSGCTGDCP